ncbi:DUF4229 domain-containing protein [Actinoallomurus sp. NPDC050550]|uniref:DUF4229 domain-containing protein n=1 Tax=Actinoallomurus sp. NPDC050550 TaxID=3154937 RepID=UPI0033F75298
MRSVLLYTLARLALFGATAGVLFLVGARGFLLLALAVLISGIVSFVLLSRQRDAVSTSVTRRAARMRENLAAGAAREDDDDPEPAASAEPGPAERREDGDPEPVTGSRKPAPNGPDAAS